MIYVIIYPRAPGDTDGTNRPHLFEEYLLLHCRHGVVSVKAR